MKYEESDESDKNPGQSGGGPPADTAKGGEASRAAALLNQSLSEIIGDRERGGFGKRLQVPVKGSDGLNFVQKGEAKKMFNRAGHLTGLISKDDPLMSNVVETHDHWWRGQIQHEHAEEFFEEFRQQKQLVPGEQVMVSVATMCKPALMTQINMDLNKQKQGQKKGHTIAASGSDAQAGSAVRPSSRPSSRGGRSGAPYSRRNRAKKARREQIAELDDDIADYFRRGEEQAAAKLAELAAREEPPEDYEEETG
ncbi:hypothetical protein F5B20DRAFT_202938 [Whalleya microplaca]|nr:hypothetical protein F5B20DRAFT_202938 [Whalleya microplaca]